MALKPGYSPSIDLRFASELWLVTRGSPLSIYGFLIGMGCRVASSVRVEGLGLGWLLANKSVDFSTVTASAIISFFLIIICCCLLCIDKASISLKLLALSARRTVSPCIAYLLSRDFSSLILFRPASPCTVATSWFEDKSSSNLMRGFVDLEPRGSY